MDCARMGFKVALVSGPRRAGKTTVICLIIGELCPQKPHYVRLAAVDGSKRAPQCSSPHTDCGVASASWLNYRRDRVFEVLPEALARVHKRDRNGCVILEADADPSLRCAYPYDCSIFVMPAPNTVEDVFRSSEQARQALRSVLHDTATFAGEIYGLPEGDSSVGTDARPERTDLTDSQLLKLLDTPLGEELGARIQLQPVYHGLVESDVVVINTGTGSSTDVIDRVVHRLEVLLSRRPSSHERRTTVFCCDPKDSADPRSRRLCEALGKLCTETH